jgi:hypothetical protein
MAVANGVNARSDQPPPYPAPVVNPNQPAGTRDDKKESYRLTVKELDKIEAGAAERERPLKRHWANVSFYLMGSLSIVLPLIFLGKLPLKHFLA